MPCAVGWAGTYFARISGKQRCKVIASLALRVFPPDALPASEVKGHNVDYTGEGPGWSGANAMPDAAGGEGVTGTSL
jgi:hypothetical protein